MTGASSCAGAQGRTQGVLYAPLPGVTLTDFSREYSVPESIRELVGLFGMSSRGTRDPKAVVTLIPLCSMGGQGRGEGRRVFGVLLSLLGIFIAAMDGVPFTLHPRFEGKSCGPLVSQCPWDGERSPASVHGDVTFLLPHDPAQ